MRGQNVCFEGFAQEITQKPQKCSSQRLKGAKNEKIELKTLIFQFSLKNHTFLRKVSYILRGRTSVCP